MNGPHLLAYTIDEPFDSAVRLTRGALERHGLRAPAELDLSGRLRQELGARLSPSLVLWIDDPVVLLEAAVFHRGAGLLIPQPLVLTGDSRRSEVRLRNPDALPADIPHAVRAPLLDLLRRMTRAVDTIAEREDSLLLAT